jgi:hypothetical protein
MIAGPGREAMPNPARLCAGARGQPKVSGNRKIVNLKIPKFITLMAIGDKNRFEIMQSS